LVGSLAPELLYRLAALDRGVVRRQEHCIFRIQAGQGLDVSLVRGIHVTANGCLNRLPGAGLVRRQTSAAGCQDAGKTRQDQSGTERSCHFGANLAMFSKTTEFV
jgi:hypothetical protein